MRPPQSAIRDPHSIDPDNRLLWRMNTRRLEVEAWRDSILAASGTLDLKLGGAAQEISSEKNTRRTVYGLIRRRDLDDLLRLYDFPDPTGHSPARFNTTTPLQQLYVLNSAFIGRQAKALGERLRKEAPEGTEQQIRRAYTLLYGREAEAQEVTAAMGFLNAPDKSPGAAWQEYLEVLLARNELIFVR